MLASYAVVVLSIKGHTTTFWDNQGRCYYVIKLLDSRKQATGELHSSLVLRRILSVILGRKSWQIDSRLLAPAVLRFSLTLLKMLPVMPGRRF